MARPGRRGERNEDDARNVSNDVPRDEDRWRDDARRDEWEDDNSQSGQGNDRVIDEPRQPREYPGNR